MVDTNEAAGNFVTTDKAGLEVGSLRPDGRQGVLYCHFQLPLPTGGAFMSSFLLLYLVFPRYMFLVRGKASDVRGLPGIRGESRG